MSRFDEKEIEVAQLTDELVHVSYINSVMQDALDTIANHPNLPNKDRMEIAQQTLESITEKE
tara:strand:- start:446 stop:631 length:186 start_codon:yes stop_codon:yes gene_type:complete